MVGPGSRRQVAAVVGPAAAVAALALALALLAAAPLGWRLGWWPFSIALFGIIPASGVAAAVAVSIALATIALAWARLGRSTLAMLLAVLMAGAGLVALPLHYDYLFRTLPYIDDIATDTDDRPAFETALAAREAASADRDATPDPELSRLQKAHYPDIQPLRTGLPAAAAFNTALAVAKAMPGWTVVAAESARGRIEAMARTRWFGFTDDIVIRVTADAGGSRIDVRSASRIGGHDLGTNAARVRAYLKTLGRAAGR